MKYLFFICLVLLLDVPQMVSGQQYKPYVAALYCTERNGIEYISKVTPQGIYSSHGVFMREDPVILDFLAGRVMGDEGEGVPYARISFIIDEDTTTLTCDALGSFILGKKSRRVPRKLKICVEAEGFDTLEQETTPVLLRNIWRDLWLIRLQRKESIKKWNEVIVSWSGVKIKIGDKILDYGGPAFSNFEGDWVGNLLRKLPGLFVSTENNRLTVNGEPIYSVDIVHWQDFDFGMKFILDDLKKKKELQKELRKSEKKKRKKDKPV